jgi:tetratricopeptide (TPR) repeat protein
MVLVAMSDDDVVDEIRAVPGADRIRDHRRRALVPSVDQVDPPVRSRLVADSDGVAAPRAVDLQEVDFEEIRHYPAPYPWLDNLTFLIDQNTEYFKSQLDALPAVERKVLASLLDAWDPCTAKQVAEAARVNTNTASAMLARLTTRGSVIKEQGRGRAAIYYAAERLFNIYYLMRRRSHPSSRVHALVSFMTEYYDRDELIDTATILAKEACSVRPDGRSDYHSTFDAILSRVPRAVRAGILEQTPPDFISSFQEHWKAEHGGALFTASADDENAENDIAVRSILARARRAIERDDLDGALRMLTTAAETHPSSASVWSRLSFVHYRRKKYDEMLHAATKLERIQDHEALGNALQGIALTGLDNPHEAKACFEKALKIEPDHPIALSKLAKIYETNEDLDEAIKLYERACEHKSLNDEAKARYARLLIKKERKEEAEALLRIEADNADSFRSRRVLAELLSDSGRATEAEALLNKATESHGGWQAWADLGSFLLARKLDAAGSRSALGRAHGGRARRMLRLRSLWRYYKRCRSQMVATHRCSKRVGQKR